MEKHNVSFWYISLLYNRKRGTVMFNYDRECGVTAQMANYATLLFNEYGECRKRGLVAFDASERLSALGLRQRRMIMPGFFTIMQMFTAYQLLSLAICLPEGAGCTRCSTAGILNLARSQSSLNMSWIVGLNM